MRDLSCGDARVFLDIEIRRLVGRRCGKVKRHIMRHLGEALEKVRKAEYARLSGQDRRFIKGLKYTLLSRHENLTLEGRQSLKKLLAANKRLNTAYLLKESFGQLWDYAREGWARRFFENWRASLRWQRLIHPHDFLKSQLSVRKRNGGAGS